MASDFFLKSPVGSVQSAITKRRNSWSAIARGCRVTITVDGHPGASFPNSNPNILLDLVTVSENGDYMTARKCQIAITCLDINDFNNIIEPAYGYIDAKKNVNIKFEWDDPYSEAEMGGPWQFRILDPSFKYNVDGSISLNVSGIGAGSTAMSVNVFDTAFVRFGGTFISDYNWVNTAKPVETLADYFYWKIQTETNTMNTISFDPRHGSNGVLEAGFSDKSRWLVVDMAEEFYEAPDQSVADAKTSLQYVSLIGIVETINKYYIGGTGGNDKPLEIKCNPRGVVSYKTADGGSFKIYSANPMVVYFPYTDPMASDYVAYGDAPTSIQQGKFFELSKSSLAKTMLQACDIGSGDLSGIMINIELLKKIIGESLQSQRNDVSENKDVSKLPLDVFFKKIFDSIKELSGGAFDLELRVNSEETTPSKSIYEIRNRREIADASVTPAVFEPRDGSTLDFTIQSKVTQDLIAAAYGSQVSSKGDSSAPTTTLTRDESEMAKEGTGLPTFQELGDARSLRLVASGFKQDGVQACTGVLKRLVSEQSAVEKTKQTSVLYPIEFAVTIYGLDKLRFGDAVTTSFLPARYKKEVSGARVIFTVYELEHKYEGTGGSGQWYTLIKTMLRFMPANKYIEPNYSGATQWNDEDEKNTLLTNMTTKIQQEQNKKVKANNNTNNQSTQTQLDDLARP